MTAQPTDSSRDAGDIGRRIAHRRAQLGLSLAEAAQRAGMATTYLSYLEHVPAEPERATLLRLAAALDTSAAALLGGGTAGPPGTGPAAYRPVLLDLPKAECWVRLGQQGVGRVALGSPGGPLVLPVNYRVLDGTLVFRTAWRGPLAAAAGARIALEVDRLDEVARTGWSVLARGVAIPIDDRPALEHLERGGTLDPWAGGERHLWLRLRPDHLSGRVISAGQEG